MDNPQWLERLQTRMERFPSFNLCSDIAALSLVELWGAYCYLSRLVES